MSQKTEFSVQSARHYDQRGPLRWIVSHVWRYKLNALVTMACYVMAWLVFAGAPLMIGRAAQEIIRPTSEGGLLWIALTILGFLVTDGICMLTGSLSAEHIAAKIAADSREELYASLLGKSQSFHDRQRVGDIMARATDDVNQLSSMMVPGASIAFEMLMGIVVPLIYIASLRAELLIVPLAFVVSYAILVRRYMRRLLPLSRGQRDQFGKLNASLEETLAGIEVVKASAQELFERRKYRTHARLFRDIFVGQGHTEARYLPLLVYGFALGMLLLHAMLLYGRGRVGIAQVVGAVGLMNLLRFPTFISVFSFSLLQSGLASAERILAIIRAETGLDENRAGKCQPIAGAIAFENVSFGYEPTLERSNVLLDITFHVQPGQTVAIVGQTGSGKSALTQLINRTYDVSAGRVLIDEVDVREWNLDALRSQIAKIEQDVFLFSRTLRENIAFGAPDATQEQIEQAAREAQAHEFIMSFPDGYATVVGERGVTLSGGQRQRIALARAFLNNPRILILDDSTSAIDSATEDQIQRAIRRAQQGRTTLLITHRLSQIRWADHILVLEQGRLAGSGTHDELLRRSPHYRRIFARYDVELPPLEQSAISSEQSAESISVLATDY
ncbi:MAG TPA: ABC transporter ATP-binding protein [Roseiflexaceae bacterium]|nr:ABC transporter ATP-binding protein [Roseiflexaceae bacterium]